MTTNMEDLLGPRLREALDLLSQTYVQPVPGDGPASSLHVALVRAEPSRTRRALRLSLVGLAAVLLLVVAVLVSTGAFDSNVTRPTSPTPDNIFPTFPHHHGPDVYVVPGYLPDRLSLTSALAATGTTGGHGGFGDFSTIQSWVALGRNNAAASAFTLAWGTNDREKALAALSPAERAIASQAPVDHSGFAVDRYRTSGEPVSIAGRTVYYLASESKVAWVEHGDIVIVAAPGPLPGPDQAGLEQIAATVRRTGSHEYRVTRPPAGYRFAGQAPSFAETGTNSRTLSYSDRQGHGFSIWLTNNNQTPPGMALNAPQARVVAVNRQPAVLTPQLGYSQCVPGFTAPCTRMADEMVLQWVEPSNTSITITAESIPTTELLAIARKLKPSSLAHWKQLGNTCTQSTPPAGFNTVAILCQDH